MAIQFPSYTYNLKTWTWSSIPANNPGWTMSPTTDLTLGTWKGGTVDIWVFRIASL